MLPINCTLGYMQTNWKSQLDPLLVAPLNQGQVLKSVTLKMGTNVINHLLARPLQGWFPTRVRANATLYDTQDANPYPSLTLMLVASADVVVDLYVF
jgi:hypothetical protein